MMEIKAALDAAFAAYADALANGAPEDVALDAGIARYRAFFPGAAISVFEVAIEAAREKNKAAADLLEGGTGEPSMRMGHR